MRQISCLKATFLEFSCSHTDLRQKMQKGSVPRVLKFLCEDVFLDITDVLEIQSFGSKRIFLKGPREDINILSFLNMWMFSTLLNAKVLHFSHKIYIYIFECKRRPTSKNQFRYKDDASKNDERHSLSWIKCKSFKVLPISLLRWKIENISG